MHAEGGPQRDVVCTNSALVYTVYERYIVKYSIIWRVNIVSYVILVHKKMQNNHITIDHRHDMTFLNKNVHL
jgi:hypothetical protein